MNPDQFGLEEVVLQVAVGHHAANAIFGKARGFNAQLAQDIKNGREHIAITLQLYDDQFASLSHSCGNSR